MITYVSNTDRERKKQRFHLLVYSPAAVCGRRLSWSQAGSWELTSSLPVGEQEPKYCSHRCCVSGSVLAGTSVRGQSQDLNPGHCGILTARLNKLLLPLPPSVLGWDSVLSDGPFTPLSQRQRRPRELSCLAAVPSDNVALWAPNTSDLQRPQATLPGWSHLAFIIVEVFS